MPRPPTTPYQGSPRRFPTPWRAVETPAGYIVEDAERRPVCFVYHDIREGMIPNENTIRPDDARRLAVNIAKLPDLLARLRAGRR